MWTDMRCTSDQTSDLVTASESPLAILNETRHSLVSTRLNTVGLSAIYLDLVMADVRRDNRARLPIHLLIDFLKMSAMRFSERAPHDLPLPPHTYTAAR